ncbi:carbohydrate esterase family 15 protein [Zopfia rhizophila CBS 207.26]|uniref:(4-O-methyl)-D-glucuronate--lignin esterase n=1 Tax=Zopfia rhizophila CBS 207.26 TaxID=1314779 RepID=A0A6A6EM10_9PEZI|nr:carbohydrate esterase family 15 protein [Zopfia rhizophila CBS 207.26]
MKLSSFLLAVQTFTVTSARFCPPWKLGNTTISNNKLPDPFTFLHGERVSAWLEWLCRRDEILALLQQWQFGPIPDPPWVNASLSTDNKTMMIDVTADNRKISYSVELKLPAGKGPFPAMISLGGGNIPLNDTGVATIIYNNEEIAGLDANSRGKGKYYDFYGKDDPTGALVAQAWGVSNIINVLQDLGPNITKIDTDHIGVTGCSRNGRGALVAGAFDNRIVLTIPQEAGVGGPACWRQWEARSCTGSGCSDIPGKPGPWDEAMNPYYRKEFPDNIKRDFKYLPFDQHYLAALIAPRGLLVLENDNVDWDYPVASATCSTAGRMVYEALGAKKNMGFSMTGGHGHCTFPSKEAPGLKQFLEGFLKSDVGMTEDVWISKVDVDMPRWVDWSIPPMP